MKTTIALLLSICFVIEFANAQVFPNTDNSPPYVADVFDINQPNPNGTHPYFYDICRDLDGGMYACGNLGYSFPVFNGTLLNSTFHGYIVKFDDQGQVLLNIPINGSPRDLCFDEAKNIYCHFEFSGFITFNGITYYDDYGDYMIAKWDSLGNEIWIQQFGIYRINDIAVNPAGTKLACIGSFGDSATVDSVIYYPMPSSSGYHHDLFLAELDANNGDTLWVEILGNEGNESAYSIEMDDNGYVYTCVEFSGTSTQLSSAIVTRTNLEDYFATVICKFDTTGIPLWYFLIDGQTNIHSTTMHENNLYFNCFLRTGSFTFGPNQITNNYATTSYFGNLNTDGELLWLNTINLDTGNIAIFDISINQQGELITYGTKSVIANVYHDSLAIDTFHHCAFYMKFRANGQLAWYKNMHAPSFNEYLRSIEWGKGNEFYCAYQNLTYGSNTHLDNFTLYNWDHTHTYIVKMVDAHHHNLELNPGWDIVSSYVDPIKNNMVEVCSSIDTSLVVIKNYDGDVFWPQFAINNIGNWDMTQAYQIKMQEGNQLPIVGNPITPSTTLLEISSGWNLLPYYHKTAMPVDSVFSSYSNAILVKGGNGLVYWPQYGVNLLGTMEPGKGYHVQASQGFDFYY